MPTIVTLCGSTKFKEEFLQVNKFLTLKGFIVLMPGVFGHSGDEITDEQKEQLDKLHQDKILLSEFIVVINKDGYIGESTQKEIEFARKRGINVVYWYDYDTEN